MPGFTVIAFSLAKVGTARKWYYFDLIGDDLGVIGHYLRPTVLGLRPIGFSPQGYIISNRMQAKRSLRIKTALQTKPRMGWDYELVDN